GVARGSVEVAPVGEGDGSLGEGALHQGVPGCEDLVVPPGVDALFAGRVELLARLLELRLRDLRRVAADVEDVRALEVAFLRDPVVAADELRVLAEDRP